MKLRSAQAKSDVRGLYEVYQCSVNALVSVNVTGNGATCSLESSELLSSSLAVFV